jgi:hypothetical protein
MKDEPVIMAAVKNRHTNFLLGFVFLTFIVSIVFVIIRIISAPTIAPSSEITVRIKSDYILMLLQCVLGVVSILLPWFVKRKANLHVPPFMISMYAIFLYCAIYLGEVRIFFYRVPHWDTVSHVFSGMALGALGFSVVSLLHKPENIITSLSPVFVALFAFCFSLSLGVIWEIYEFSMDYFLHTNMQKYSLESGILLAGQTALTDTMKDLIVDAIGAFAMSVIGYISLKYNKSWLEKIHIKRI